MGARPHVQGPTPAEAVERLVDADLFARDVEVTVDRRHVLVVQACRWQASHERVVGR